MRQPQPFFRKSKQSLYLQLGKRQVSLGTDEKAAWERYHAIMAANEPLKRETATLESLFERDLNWVQEHGKPGTYKTIRHHLSHCVKALGRSLPVAKLGGSDLSDWAERENTWHSTTRHDANRQENAYAIRHSYATSGLMGAIDHSPFPNSWAIAT